jgi:hypothetical protein
LDSFWKLKQDYPEMSSNLIKKQKVFGGLITKKDVSKFSKLSKLLKQ